MAISRKSPQAVTNGPGDQLLFKRPLLRRALGGELEESHTPPLLPMDNAEEEVVQFCHPAELGLPASRESLGRQCWLESRQGVLFVKNYLGYGNGTGLDPIDDPRFCTILPG
ncbi:hypothetical protein DUI87_27177 [Hirundo rustica rustica]|uniref:Uncharacterized protein n=1 Tax=Hirundo rustica rustica TaxID=333673 RepID=A0A3M0J672_HIRRU|nr:hypothetical protein DUI87_27177 [Hirundo rustica rustica]